MGLLDVAANALHLLLLVRVVAFELVALAA